MDNVAYYAMIERGRKAEEIYVILKELYPEAHDNTRLFLRAKIDKVITGAEHSLLRECYS